MNKLTVLLLMATLSLGCAQVMATGQPGPLDRTILQAGAERSLVAGSMGAPIVTEPSPDGTLLVETYNYTDGGSANHAGAKAGRIVVYTAADIFTLFLTQLLWIPAEIALDGTDYSATVEYERNPVDERWKAVRITETKLEGNRKTRVRAARTDVAARPATTKTTIASPARRNGSCFAIGAGRLVTAVHVVEGSQNLTVQLSDGRTMPASVQRISRGADLAILQIDEETNGYLTMGSSEPIQVGQRVFTIGFPATEILGPDPRFSEGSIGGLSGPQGDATLLQITVPVQPGNAGGPIVNARGEVVGIATSTAAFDGFHGATDALPQNANWAVNAEYAAALVGEQEGLPPAATREEAIDRTRAAVCRVQVEG